MQKFLSRGFTFLLHIGAACLLVYFLQPIANWYLNKIPALGVDLYNSVTSVALFQKHLSWWFSGYRDIWFAGYPLANIFPSFHYYLMLPFSNYFGTVKGIQVFAVVTLFLLVFCCYLLYYRISRNVGLAILLAVLIMLSPNIYGSMTWGGSLPYFANQFLLPLVLFFVITYAETQSRRWIWAAALFTGFGILSHPLAIGAFVIPSVILLLLFYPYTKKKWNIKERIRDIIFYSIGLLLVSFFYAETAFSTIFNLFNASPPVPGDSAKAAVQIAKAAIDPTVLFYRGQIAVMYKDANQFLFIALVVGILAFIIGILLKRQPRRIFSALALLLVLAYIAFHIIYNLTGHSLFPQGLYRAFWAFPVVLAALIAALYNPLIAFFTEKSSNTRLVGHVTRSTLSLGITGFFVVVAFVLYSQQINGVISRIFKTSETSSAFPEILDMKLTNADQEQLKKQIAPSFMDPNDKNWRLYASDATFNVWWNSLYDMPLVRGYVDPPIGTTRMGGFFMLDTSLTSNTLVTTFKYTEAMARNYALYLVDWYGIRYFEGPHTSQGGSAGFSSYLTDIFDKKEIVTTNGAILRFTTASGMPEARPDLLQKLPYFRISDQYTSPIVSGSNAPAVLVISDGFGFENIWRLLAAENLNSRFVIPVLSPTKFIDDFNKDTLKQFDAVILYGYDYHNKDKVYQMLSDYVGNGGKLFIDTGGDVKESVSDSLPDLLPIKRSQSNVLQKEWNFTIHESALTKDIDFAAFSPPVIDNDPWKFSFPVDASDIKDDAHVVLENQGKPILVERTVGNGKVIWSGMNLPYHFTQAHLDAEAKFFRNILQEMVPLTEHPIVSVRPTWDSPEKIEVAGTEKVKGILVKEENYKWSAQSSTPGLGNLKVYSAGPTYPGFIYIPIPDSANGAYNITITFVNDIIYWEKGIVSILGILVLAELFIFNGVFIGKHGRKLHHYTKKKIGSWWQKEDEV